MADKNTEGVIYLEVDEDITSAVDKLTSEPGSAVQIVTAKRSTLFQSVINLKLLKKAAADANKDLVLVTSDKVATNLAGRIGVPIASQVGEPGAVPKAAAAAAAMKAVGDEDEIDGGTVGDVVPAAKPAQPEPHPAEEAVKQVPAPEAPKPAASPADAAQPKDKKPGKKSAVPSIGKMQKRALWAGAAVAILLLIVGLNFYFTRATVTLFAKGAQVNSSFDFTADPSARQSDIGSATLAATELSLNKTLNASVQATGTKDLGTKASGTITVYNEYDSNDQALVAGTRFVTSDGKVFRSTADATVPGGSVSGGKIVAGKTTVSVQADQNGDQYNVGPTRYSIPGLSAAQQSGIYGQGQQMQGGSSKTAKVITQADIDRAQQAAVEADKAEAQKDLKDKAGKSQVVLEPSLQQKVTKSNPSPAAGSEASSGTVAISVEYTQLAVKQSELSELAKSKEQEQIGQDKEIYDDGSGNLQLKTMGAATGSGAQKFRANATAFAGTKIDKDALVKDIKGKKIGEATEIAQRLQDVEKAEIKVTPTWATSLPLMTSHIKVEVKVSNQ